MITDTEFNKLFDDHKAEIDKILKKVNDYLTERNEALKRILANQDSMQPSIGLVIIHGRLEGVHVIDDGALKQTGVVMVKYFNEDKVEITAFPESDQITRL